LEIDSCLHLQVLLLLLLRFETPIRQGVLHLLKAQTIIDENLIGSISAPNYYVKFDSQTITRPMSTLFLIINNQILEIENVDDVDDVTTICLVTI
jgi:hypothetical protein